MSLEPQIKTYILSQLRRIFRWSSGYKETKRRSRVFKEVYRCEGCGSLINKKGSVPALLIPASLLVEPVYNETLHVDHIDPVIPTQGFTNDEEWSKVIIGRVMQPASGLQYLCQCCHYIKTQIENEERRGVYASQE